MHVLLVFAGGVVRLFWAAKVDRRPWGPPGFGSPSWRISGSTPPAELGAKRSTTRLMYISCNKHNKAWEG